MQHIKKNPDGSIYDDPSTLIDNAIEEGFISLDKQDDSVSLNVIKPQKWKSFLSNIIKISDNDFEKKFVNQLLDKFDDFINEMNVFFGVDEETQRSIIDIDKLKDMINNSETVDEFIDKM